MAARSRILNSRSETIDAISDSCEKCGTTNIEQTVAKEPDFDENGWWYPVVLKCKSAKCGHSWTEKIVVASGGFR